jgi:hypothetical protein
VPGACADAACVGGDVDREAAAGAVTTAGGGALWIEAAEAAAGPDRTSAPGEGDLGQPVIATVVKASETANDRDVT